MGRFRSLNGNGRFGLQLPMLCYLVWAVTRTEWGVIRLFFNLFSVGFLFGFRPLASVSLILYRG
ncbi:hypothetical protein BDQ17DRAFT_1351291 [Cyathus striatus]|nr:hypothetical protein BDQ17DRAFT_1351291 [Cyathus striatus]